MEYRELGRTGWKVSDVSIGTWAMGGSWGEVNDRDSMAALNRALDLGVNFFDTADVYGSEPLLGQLRRQRHEPFYIATKVGRGLEQDPRFFTRANLTAAVEDCLRNLGMDSLDLVQLHCPPTPVFNAETFGIMDDLVKQGKVRHYGVSVEKIAEALTSIKYPNVETVQLIFNIFRQRPIDDFFPEAKRRKVGIIARVPLASGMLTGKMTRDTKFARDDHRSFNREGQAFDKGETFSGVDYEKGLAAVEELRPLVRKGESMAQLALRWILMFDAVTCAIPGAKRISQVEELLSSSDLTPLPDDIMAKIRGIYDEHIRADVHHLW